MIGLERRLTALGSELDFPGAPPELAQQVANRLGGQAPRRFPSRRALVVALAALALALGAAFAVPPARTAILEWLGLRGVRIERVPEPPRAPTVAELGLGLPVTLADARRQVSYPIVVPEGLQAPDEVYVDDAHGVEQVAFVYLGEKAGAPRLLLAQFRAEAGELIEKAAGPGTTIEPVTVAGEEGFWLAGEPHAFAYRGPDGEVRQETFRLAGDVLLWERGPLTLRLEGASSKAEALRIAESIR